MSRSWLQRLIDDGNVLVDGQVRSRTFKVTPGQVIEVSIPPIEEDELIAEEMPLGVVYAGPSTSSRSASRPAWSVHPTPVTAPVPSSMPCSTIRRRQDGRVQRPGIVHRLDRAASGFIVIGRSDAGRLALLDHGPAVRHQGVQGGDPGRAIWTPEFAIDAPIGRDPTQRKRMAVIQSGKRANVRDRSGLRHRSRALSMSGSIPAARINPGPHGVRRLPDRRGPCLQPVPWRRRR